MSEKRTRDLSPLPSSWNWTTVGELTEVIRGSSPRPKGDPRYFGGDIPWIMIADVTRQPGKYLYKTREGVTKAGAQLSRLIAAGELILSNSATVCVPKILKVDGCIHDGFVAFPTLKEKVDLDFAYYWFEFIRPQMIQENRQGITQVNLNTGIVREMHFPFAPRKEQRRIVAEIEKQFTRLEAGVAALRRVQANLKRYRAAVLKAACEGRLVPTEAKWKQTVLGEVLIGIEAGRSFKCEERPPKPDEIGVVKVSAVTWGTYDETESKTCLDASRMEEKFFVRPEDFLFSRANTIELVGACVIAKKVTLRVMLSDKILRFRFSAAANPSWILYWLRSGFGHSEIERLATGNQNSMRNIGQDRIRQIIIKLPPLAEQTRIVAEVERRLSVVEELESVVSQRQNLPIHFKYWAFISYSHADEKWGNWLHNALETYKVPNALVGRQAHGGEKVPRHLFPIFRDREELPTSSDLSSAITEELRQSGCLIVICSPRAAQSRWVNQEILDYKKLGRQNRILALIVDGEPNAADPKPDVRLEAECFPEALKYSLGADGSLDKERRTEPIAADARPEKDGKINARLKLLAGILGINYDDLKRRDEKRRRRQRIITALSVLAVATAISGTWLWQEKAKLSQTAMSLVIRAHEFDLDEPSAGIYYARANSLSESHVARANAVAYIYDKSLPLQVFQHGNTNIWTAEFSPDGLLLLTGGDDNMARLWNVATGEAIGRGMPNDAPVARVKFSMDGKRILTETINGAVRVWDSRTCAPYGKGLIVAGADIAWDNGLLDIIDAPFGDCTFFGSNGNYVVRHESGEPIKFYDIKTGTCVGTQQANLAANLRKFCFSPDGEKAVLIAADGSSHVWNLRGNRSIGAIPRGQTAASVESIAFSADGKRIALGGSNKGGGSYASFYDANTCQPLGRSIQSTNDFLAVFFKPDGQTVVAKTADGAQDWNIANGQAAGERYLPYTWSGDGYVPYLNSGAWKGYGKYLRLSPNGRTMAAVVFAQGAGSQTAQVWELRRSTNLLSTSRVSGPMSAVAFSPDRKMVLTAKGNAVQFWQATNGNLIRQLSGFPSSVDALAISPDGKWLLIGNSEGTARIWDLKNQKQIGYSMAYTNTERLVSRVVLSVAFSPKGEIAASGNADFTVRFWNVPSGAPLSTPILEDESYVHSLAFSPDARVLVSGSGKSLGSRIRPGTAQLWDTRSGKSIRKIVVSDSEVLSLAFSPDGKTIATGDGDGSVRFWDVTTGEEIGKEITLESAVAATAFDLSGGNVITASSDGAVQVWDVKWLTTDISAPELLLRVQLATHCDVAENGTVRRMSQAEWLALFRKYQSLSSKKKT